MWVLPSTILVFFTYLACPVTALEQDCTAGLDHQRISKFWNQSVSPTPDLLVPARPTDEPGTACANPTIFGHDNIRNAALKALESEDESKVFITENGANSGIWIAFRPDCLGTLAWTAAEALRPYRAKERALYLYSVSGLPIRDANDVFDNGPLLSLLLQGEAWVWGGVEPGFSFEPLPGVVMTTASLSPRAFQVRNVLSDTIVDGLIESGKRRMMRSPERHYSPGFENYRTSTSAFLTGSHKSHSQTRNICQLIARLPTPQHPEWPQLLRYDPGEWYKQHRDTFHNYKHPSIQRGVELPTEFNRWLQLIIKSRSNIRAHELKPPSSMKNDIQMNRFQLKLADALLKSHHSIPEDVRSWVSENVARESSELLSSLTDFQPALLTHIQTTWEEAVDAPPSLRLSSQWNGILQATIEEYLGVPYVEPNRHCTLMMYLNDPINGGAETGFPLAPYHGLMHPDGSFEAGQAGVNHEGIPECSRGFRMQPFTGGATLFYHKHGNGTNDELSSHTGCPPNEGGLAWKVNGFMWNVPSDEGPKYFS